MAREIHDTLAQGLTGIITQLQAAEQASGRSGALAPARGRRDQAGPGEPVRGPAFGARAAPGAAGAGRLEDALAGVAERWSALHGVAVRVTTTGTVRPVPPEAEVALLRAAQEALANVAKHARATRVGLTLSYMDDEVALDVRDDGRGFDRGQHGRKRPAASAWSRCGSGSRACPGRCRSNRNPGRHGDLGLIPAARRARAWSGPRDRPACAEPAEHADAAAPDQAADRRRPPRGPGRAERRCSRRDAGFEVVGEAADGAEAVRLARALAPRRDPDGPADAGHGRRGRDHRAGPARRRPPGCWC